jgi:hypothetical protein
MNKRVAYITGLTLWALGVFAMFAIPSQYWHYPDDLWLRVLVSAPVMAAVVLLLISRTCPKDPKARNAPPT